MSSKHHRKARIKMLGSLIGILFAVLPFQNCTQFKYDPKLKTTSLMPASMTLPPSENLDSSPSLDLTNETPSLPSFDSSPTGTRLLPRDLIDLSVHKLTLPVNKNGEPFGTAYTVQTNELLGGYTSPYFYVSDDFAVVFHTPSNGATTTPGQGSDHTRSELREIYTASDAIGNKEWSTNFEDSSGGEMTGDLRIDSVAQLASGVIFGQIHGTGGAAFVLLVYRTSSKRVDMKIYDTPSMSSATTYVLARNVNLGDRFKYRLSFTNDKVVGEIIGQTPVVATVDPQWVTFPVHFAAGAYHSVNNTGNADGDATQVSYFTLDIKH